MFRSEAQQNQLVREVCFSSQSQDSSSNWYDGSPDQFHGVETDYYGYEGGGVGYGCIEDGLVAYKPPRRDESCRICKVLEGRGDTLDIYEGHFHSYPTGCPRYIVMTIDERLDVAMAAKICLCCHDPEYIYRPKDTDHVDNNCSVKVKGKGRFTCKSPGCYSHMWICNRHRTLNLEYLNKFKDEIRLRHGLTFGFVVSIPKFAANAAFTKRNVGKVYNTRSPTKPGPSLSPRKSKHKGKIKRKVSINKEVKAIGGNKAIDNLKVVEPIPNQEPIEASTCNVKSMSSNQALKKLKKKMSASGVQQELRPVPQGRAQFIIGYTKGKTRGLLTLYDTGCGSVLFKEGVPQRELGTSVLKTKGPFIVKGVGDTSVKVNDEHMCSVSLTDGTRQVLEGWTVDKITATLPTVNLTIAEAEIKASLKHNEELQSMSCHPTVGGDCDILLGLLYQSIFPTAIHSLENGLTIYKLKITPHDDRYNCAIGGPHESFEFMATQFGSMSAVFANLCQQLESYKNIGPPKISKVFTSLEDLDFAKKRRELDWEVSIDKKAIPENKVRLKDIETIHD